MVLIEKLKLGEIPQEIKDIANYEDLPVEDIIENVKSGKIVIPQNKTKKIKKKCGIGKNLSTKVNVNIGTSPDCVSLELELRKLEIAIKFNTDTIMDLSIGGDIKKIRREIIKNSTVPVGTVPIYEVVCEAAKRGKEIQKIEPEQIFSTIEEHCADGVDFITVHCGVTKENVEIAKRIKRLCGIVSRGGTFHAQWIISNDKENPLYEHFDRLLDIAYKYDVTLSLGDGLRPGSIFDACDEAQIAELKTNAELVKLAREKGVQVIVEGPGHMPIDKIQEHIKLMKELTDEAPFYLLGPLVTDISAGFDHITSAIGACVAASSGADFICYVTPSEHISLPEVEDVYLGLIAAKIAAHAADISKGIKKAKALDYEFSTARKKLDWEKQLELSIDKSLFKKMRERVLPSNREVCTMCGKYCAMRISNILGI